jgi:hypothetical protein
MSVFRANAVFSQCPDEPTCRRARGRTDNRASERGNQPTGGNYGADARDRHKPETSQPPRGSSKNRASGGAFARIFGCIIAFNSLDMLVISDDADPTVWYASRL